MISFALARALALEGLDGDALETHGQHLHLEGDFRPTFASITAMIASIASLPGAFWPRRQAGRQGSRAGPRGAPCGSSAGGGAGAGAQPARTPGSDDGADVRCAARLWRDRRDG